MTQRVRFDSEWMEFVPRLRDELAKLQERLTKTLKGVDEQVDPPPPPDPPPPIDAPDRMR